MSNHSELVQILVACEESRIRLERGIAQNVDGNILADLVAARVAALEALAEHQRLVPSAPGAFVPACDKHVKPNRQKNRQSKNRPAA